MKKVIRFFSDKSFWRQTAFLALPIALQNLLTSSFTLVDTLMVGQLGDVKLSAVGMAGQWSWLLSMAMFGICSGTSVLIAQFWGAEDKKSIHKVCGLSLSIGAAISLVFMLFGHFFPERIVGIFNRDARVIAEGSKYLRIASFSYPGTILGFIIGAILRSTEDVRLPVYSAVITTFTNAFLDYALIFGAFGFPEMGIEGAALATCISAWLGPVILFIASMIKKNILFAPVKSFLSFDRSLIRTFVRTATPVVINESLWGAGTFLYNVIFANLGYENYAAVTILRTIESISFIFSIGLCDACCVMVGKNVGGGNVGRAVRDASRFAVLMPLFSIIVGAVMIVFCSPLIGLFNLKGELSGYTLSVARMITVIFAVELPVRNAQYLFIVGIFRSGGDTVTSAKIDLIPLWLVAIPLTAVSAYVIKAPFPFVFAAMYFGEDYIKTIASIKFFFSYRWLKPVTPEGKESLSEFLEAKKNKNC